MLVIWQLASYFDFLIAYDEFELVKLKLIIQVNQKSGYCLPKTFFFQQYFEALDN